MRRQPVQEFCTGCLFFLDEASVPTSTGKQSHASIFARLWDTGRRVTLGCRFNGTGDTMAPNQPLDGNDEPLAAETRKLDPFAEDSSSGLGPWQFSFRSLFLLTTAVAIALSAWKALPARVSAITLTLVVVATAIGLAVKNAGVERRMTRAKGCLVMFAWFAAWYVACALVFLAGITVRRLAGQPEPSQNLGFPETILSMGGLLYLYLKGMAIWARAKGPSPYLGIWLGRCLPPGPFLLFLLNEKTSLYER